jgi:putative hemolysin
MARTIRQFNTATIPAATALKLIDLSQHNQVRPFWPVIGGPVECLLGLDRLNRAYARFCSRMETTRASSAEAFHLALETLGVSYALRSADHAKIPATGPLVVVANHPFGGIEGLILGDILCRMRPDVKILGNYLLKEVSGINTHIIPVDPFQNRNRRPVASNRKGLRTALSWLGNGGVLVTFPAGEVASFDPLRRRVQDPPWNAHIAGLIHRSGASALPVFFPGRNSLLFQLAGLIHPLLRTALLPRELLNKTTLEITIHIGKSITRHQMRRFTNDTQRVTYLRAATHFLANRKTPPSHPQEDAAAARASTAPAHKLVERPESENLWASEVAQLPNAQCLAEQGHYAVYIADAPQIPNLLREIGRLREITFREVNEGTGESIDIDRFDAYYRHLFLWHRQRKELAGAYRLGLADRILAARGPAGLYTHELFAFKPELVAHLAQAIEFGRSFIRSEYQKKFQSLTLLWRGIGAFVSRHPRYNILFGAVSISRDYHRVSRNLMVRFLKENRFDRRMSRLVKPRNPYRSRRIEEISRRLLRSSFQDITDVSVLISEIEQDGKGIPVLLRHYLNLNGKFLSFNVDKMFSDVVDGLLVVDLKHSDPRLLKRFMGKQGYRHFSRYHGLDRQGVPPWDRAATKTAHDDRAA